jgi:ferredoxin
MSTALPTILAALDRRIEEMAQACTRCGRCVEVCPMPAAISAGSDAFTPQPVATIEGVLSLLRDGDGDGNDDAARWARACSGTGTCIQACPEDLNPRFMLAMARRALQGREPARERRARGREAFQKMSRGVRVLSRLQLPPALIERLSPSSHPQSEEPPELVFYTGCNLLKTPHIGLLCLDVLDRLGVRYEVHGGAASCCGILPMREGDDGNGLRQGVRTLDRLAASGASQVLSWCPTCQIKFEETTLPALSGREQLVALDGIARPASPSQLDLTMFPVFLAARLAALRPHLRIPVHKRVALHAHPGAAGVTEAVTALLAAVPGVELVDLHLPSIGYSLNSLAAVPRQRAALLARELAAAEAAGVTTLADLYHSDHRELGAHEQQWPFEIVNFMEILGESMGLHREDGFKRLKLMGDVDAILHDSADMIALHGLDLDEVREVVLSDMLGERMLPVDRATHTAFVEDA